MLPESEANSQVDWTYDPNEPRYCICNQVTSALASCRWPSLVGLAVGLAVDRPLAGPPLRWNRCDCCWSRQVSYGEMVGCDNTDVSTHTLAKQVSLRSSWRALSAPGSLSVSHRVVPLRLRGPDGGSQGEVVLSPVHGRHEEAGQPTQVDASRSAAGWGFRLQAEPWRPARATPT